MGTLSLNRGLRRRVDCRKEKRVMADRDGRESLRGVESEVLDMLFETSTDEQWTEMLEAPLERAAFEGNEDIARKLIEAGAAMGCALHFSIRARRRKVAKFLLDLPGAPVNRRGMYGDLPLCLAAEAGDEMMVRSLILKGAGLHASDPEGRTALYIAARDGHEPVARSLFMAGAEVNTEYPRPLVHPAAENGHVGILRMLIRSGVDVDAREPNYEETALHCAASSGKTSAIEFLIEAGADLNARDAEGNTPLGHAVSVCKREVVHTLLKRGADVNAPNEAEETPLRTAAANAGRQGASGVVDLLLRSGADERRVAADGLTPMEVVGDDVAGKDPVAEDVERMRELLEKAPADRTWRRRGLLVLCRAFPDRVQPGRKQSDAEMAMMDVGQGADGSDGESTMKRKGCIDWTVVAARVVDMKSKEENTFRTIVGFL